MGHSGGQIRHFRPQIWAIGVDEIFSTLRSRRYDITKGEVVSSLIMQGVPIGR